MGLVYFGENKQVKSALRLAQYYLGQPGFLEERLSHVKKFDATTAKPSELAAIFREFYSTHAVEVKTYATPRWRRSRVLAYTNNQTCFYLNTSNFKRSDASIAGTIAHEWVHACDNWAKKHRFGHGDNSSHRKADTVPYWIGYDVKRLFSSLDGIRFIVTDEL